MTADTTTDIIEAYFNFLNCKDFPCIGAKAALAHGQMHCMVAGHMACPNDDGAILKFLYHFIDDCRNSTDPYHSAAVIFKQPVVLNEKMFDALLWQRLQALSDMDAKEYPYDKRVDADVASSNFSFSLKEEALFILGLNPASERSSRKFAYPVVVFNPHAQFEKLRAAGRYETMKETVRKRDVIFSGSVNPMLDDFGNSSEVYQYSGMQYDEEWQCPLKINHANK